MKWIRLFLLFSILTLWADDKTPVPAVSPTETETHETHELKKTEPLPEKPAEVNVHEATESYETAFIKTILVLVALLVLVVLTVWMFRRISHGRLRNMNYLKSVKILEKRPLSPKSMLYLIEVSGKQVLIAESQLEIRPITSLEVLEGDQEL